MRRLAMSVGCGGPCCVAACAYGCDDALLRVVAYGCDDALLRVVPMGATPRYAGLLCLHAFA